jgi:dTDP-4-dehydrorhamnose reductase
MRIAGTGLNGLIGSRLVELLSSKYKFQNLSRSTGVDILDYNSLSNAISSLETDIVLHLAAYTDVKTAELEKNLGEESESWKVNVVGTRNLVRACEAFNKKIIYFSTDMVVGGEKMPENGFDEDSDLNPLSWYSKTKAEAEKVVQNTSAPWTIIRIAYPYRSSFEKLDFVRLFIKMLKEEKQITALTDRVISPTLIDDIAGALDTIIENKATKLYNVVGSSFISIYEAAVLIAKTFNLDSSLVKRTTREEFLVGRPPEPFYSALNNDKIKKLGAEMHTFKEGLEIIKKQL